MPRKARAIRGRRVPTVPIGPRDRKHLVRVQYLSRARDDGSASGSYMPDALGRHRGSTGPGHLWIRFIVYNGGFGYPRQRHIIRNQVNSHPNASGSRRCFSSDDWFLPPLSRRLVSPSERAADTRVTAAHLHRRPLRQRGQRGAAPAARAGAGLAGPLGAR